MSNNPTGLFADRNCQLTADGTGLIVLDQTLLPNEERYITLRSAEEVADAISRLCVRGAPLIGVAAALGMAVAVRRCVAEGMPLEESVRHCHSTIANARPTAVNLRWALDSMLPHATSPESLLKAALALKASEEATFEAIALHGSSLITPGMGILTHCNAGYLATGGSYGTALAPIYKAHEQGKEPHVYADETRPLLQGARLTAYELTRRGVRTTLICDNMAAAVMAQGKVQMVLVGCDRVAANGDTANKIGTLGVAILAHHFGIPFYVCGPSSTFDPTTPTGNDIRIEQRNPEEVRSLWYRQPLAPADCHILNPAFDVTPRHLITAFITEKGIIS